MKHGLHTDYKSPADTGLLHASITEKIIEGSFEVHRTLGYGFLERVYQKALQAELVQSGLEVETEAGASVFYKGVQVGEYRSDLLVEKLVPVEIKVEEVYHPLHEAQLLNVLKSTGLRVGLLLNFGRAKVEFKRLIF